MNTPKTALSLPQILKKLGLIPFEQFRAVEGQIGATTETITSAIYHSQPGLLKYPEPRMMVLVCRVEDSDKIEMRIDEYCSILGMSRKNIKTAVPSQLETLKQFCSSGGYMIFIDHAVEDKLR